MAIRDDLAETEQLSLLRQLTESLRQQVASPQEPTFQQQTSTTLQTLRERLAVASSNQIGAFDRAYLQELEIDALLGEALRDRIDEVFSRNTITVSVALDEVSTITDDVEVLSDSISSLIEGMDYLAIGTYSLEPGECEIALGIPRAFVHNELGDLGKELTRLKTIIGPFQELTLGARPEVPVRMIASSEFQVVVELWPEVCAALASSLDLLIQGYKSVLELRRIKKELQEVTGAEAAAREVEKTATKKMLDTIEAVTETVLSEALHQPEDGRVTEVQADLKHSITSLATRIDVGYHIEVRSRPPELMPSEDGEEPAPGPPEQRFFDQIAESQENISFVHLDGPPILSLENHDDDPGSGRDD